MMNLGALLTTQWQNVNHLHVLEGICHGYRNFNSISLEWTTLVIFFNRQGVMHKEFVPGQTLNFEFYKEVMAQLLKRLWCVRLDETESGNWFMLHSNAPSHNATFVEQFLAKKSVTILYLPPLLDKNWHLQTTFYSLKWKPTLRGAILTPFQTSRTMWWVN